MATMESNEEGPDRRFTNRLGQEKSPYLLQHAHNPVDWYPWGEEAFRAARERDRPIFLSVGYSACHWCHVMERESFENPDIAAVLNQEFVSVKVDREERPDVDEVYMTAVQMTTGSGGWPMSVFLLPDGRPFYGGTYFPPESRQGRIGFPSLLAQLADAYRNRRAEVDNVADSIAEDLKTVARQRPAAASGEAVSPARLLVLAVDDMSERFDAANGGFVGAPKFPPHQALRLLTLAARAGNGDAPRLLLTTLDRMALGGIYDHVGGGFHRYATDAIWLVPHFEKMLYDNALLARVYAQAFDLTGQPAYARIARETCDWVLRDLTDAAGGGFYAALDADSEGEEGRYYVWTSAEARAAISEEPAAGDFLRAYNIRAAGNYCDEASGRATGANIPYLSTGGVDENVPADLGDPILLARARLLQARNERVPPATDDKVITAWNGLMIGALAVAGSFLKEQSYIGAARRAADFCLSVLRTSEGHLLRRYAKGSAGLPAFLDDYAFLGDGLLDLYETSGEERYLQESRTLADIMLARFWDAEDGGFFYSASDQETLIVRTKDLFDGALPSANGVAARLLARLGSLPDGARYLDYANKMLFAFNGVIARAPQGTATLIEVAFSASAGRTDGPVAGNPAVLLTTIDEEAVSVSVGESRTLVFELRIRSDCHVNTRYPEGPDYIPTVATYATDLPATFEPLSYPQPETLVSGSERLPVYQGDARFHLHFTVAADARSGNYQVRLTIHCQPCTDSVCFAPQELFAVFSVEIIP